MPELSDLKGRQSSRQSGDRGEDLARRYLENKSYAVVERNYRTRHGEIDLILRDERTLVFVEVKLRSGAGFGDPLEAVTPKKQDKIRTVAEQYLAEKEEEDFADGFEEMRFDVVLILLLPGTARKPEIQHVQNTF